MGPRSHSPQVPRINGIEVQEWLHARGIRIPVIVVSARDDDATRRRVKQCGAQFFFRKPLGQRTLMDAIATATGWDVGTGAG